MKSSVMRSAVVVIALGVLLTGCTVGRRFARITDDALLLGQTTPEQIISRLGTPEESAVIKNNEKIKVLNYFYADKYDSGSDDVSDLSGFRIQTFHFWDNKLVGHQFLSSYKADSTNFDSGKVPQIKKGEATRSDVIGLLGNPSGKLIFPVIPNKNEEEVIYSYMQFRSRGNKVISWKKHLAVTFNKEDVVINVDYTEFPAER